METIKIRPAGGIEGNEVEYDTKSLYDFILEIDGHVIRCEYSDGRLIIPSHHFKCIDVTYLSGSTYPALAIELN